LSGKKFEASFEELIKKFENRLKSFPIRRFDDPCLRNK